MPKTKITKEKWKNHLHYGKILYLVIALIAFFVSDLTYTVTEYRSPNERKVDVEIVTSYGDMDGFTEISANAFEVGHAFDETLEEVTVYNIAYDPDDSSDYYGSQKYMVMLAAQEGDVYILPYSLLEQLANEGALVSLDTYIEEGVLNPGTDDLGSLTFNEVDPDTGTATENMHVYGIPCENWYRMMDDSINIDNRGLYACILTFSKNQDTVARVLESLREQLTTEKPDWLVEYEEQQAEESENAENTAEEAVEEVVEEAVEETAQENE